MITRPVLPDLPITVLGTPTLTAALCWKVQGMQTLRLRVGGALSQGPLVPTNDWTAPSVMQVCGDNGHFSQLWYHPHFMGKRGVQVQSLSCWATCISQPALGSVTVE